MTTSITVDPIACDAYGYCAELLPELVSLDEWGYPVIDGQPVPAHLLELARRAAKDCPRRAFLLEQVPEGGGVGRRVRVARR